jgi:spore maturation protein SpmB
MKIAEKSGLILIISKVVKTITIRLFPDVPPGIGATMYGSSETTFYVLVVYFGSVGVVRGRHAIPAGLIGDLVGAIAAVFLCKLLLT